MLHALRPLVLALLVVPALAQGQMLSRDSAAMIDQVFVEFDRTGSPGCVVGVDRGDAPLLRGSSGGDVGSAIRLVA